jgi:hypothetical protein
MQHPGREPVKSASVSLDLDGPGLFGQPEIERLDRAIGRDFDVGGLQIAVHDAFFVRSLERVGNLMSDAKRIFRGSGPFGDSPTTSSITR